MSSPVGTVSTWCFAEIPPADLDIPILGHWRWRGFRAATHSNRVRWEVVRLNAPLVRGPLGQEALEHPPRDPDHAAA